MASLAWWRTTPSSEAPSVSAEDALAELDARLASAPEVEERLRRGGECGLAPPGAGLGTPTLRRWLIAEKWDVDAAFARLVTHSQWRADYVSRGGGKGASRVMDLSSPFGAAHTHAHLSHMLNRCLAASLER